MYLYTEPFFFVHVIGRKIAVLPAKRADQQRIAFHIKYINDTCLRQPQLISRYFQNHTIPFIIVVVPQHSIQSCQGYSGSVPYCWRIHVNNSCRVTPSLPRCFICGFVQQPVAQILASDNSPHCINIRNHPAQHLSLPADQSSPGQISSWLLIFSYHHQPLQTLSLLSRTNL